MSRLSKFRRLATREEWAHKTGSREFTRLINKQLSDLEGPNTKYYLWPLRARGACCRPQAPETRKVSGSGSYFPDVKRNFLLVKFLTSRHVRMHRVMFYISNTLRKLMIKA